MMMIMMMIMMMMIMIMMMMMMMIMMMMIGASLWLLVASLRNLSVCLQSLFLLSLSSIVCVHQEDNCPDAFRKKKIEQLQRKYNDYTITSMQDLKARQVRGTSSPLFLLLFAILLLLIAVV